MKSKFTRLTEYAHQSLGCAASGTSVVGIGADRFREFLQGQAAVERVTQERFLVCEHFVCHSERPVGVPLPQVTHGAIELQTRQIVDQNVQVLQRKLELEVCRSHGVS